VRKPQPGHARVIFLPNEKSERCGGENWTLVAESPDDKPELLAKTCRSAAFARPTGSAIDDSSTQKSLVRLSPKSHGDRPGHCAGNVTANLAKYTKRNPHPRRETSRPQIPQIQQEVTEKTEGRSYLSSLRCLLFKSPRCSIMPNEKAEPPAACDGQQPAASRANPMRSCRLAPASGSASTRTVTSGANCLWHRAVVNTRQLAPEAR